MNKERFTFLKPALKVLQLSCQMSGEFAGYHGPTRLLRVGSCYARTWIAATAWHRCSKGTSQMSFENPCVQGKIETQNNADNIGWVKAISESRWRAFLRLRFRGAPPLIIASTSDALSSVELKHGLISAFKNCPLEGEIKNSSNFVFGTSL